MEQVRDQDFPTSFFPDLSNPTRNPQLNYFCRLQAMELDLNLLNTVLECLFFCFLKTQ